MNFFSRPDRLICVSVLLILGCWLMMVPGMANAAKRLSTNNLDYANDAIKDWEARWPVLKADFDKAKAEGRLYEGDSAEELVVMELHYKVQKLLSSIHGYYDAARKDGWTKEDAELAPIREASLKAGKEALEIGYWTSFNPDEDVFANTPNMDKMRMKALAAQYIINERKNPLEAQELMDKVDRQIETLLEAAKSDDQGNHPSLARVQAEIARIKKECEAGFKLAEQAKAEAIKSWKALYQEYQRLESFKNIIQNGGSVHPNDFATFIEKIETFEKQDAPKLQTLLGDLGKMYGNTPDALNKSMEALVGNDKPENVSELGYIARELQDLSNRIGDSRKENAEAVLGCVNQEMSSMSVYSEDIRAKKWEELKALIALGLRYDPHNAGLIEVAAKAEETAAKSSADMEKEFNERKWPENVAAFAGPGTPEELCKGALDYFNSTCQPNEKALKASIAEADWYCFKRNIFGQPVQWALTFMVAVELEEDKEKGIINLWSISFLTEEAVGVEKAPPFKMAAFNFKKKMKRSNIPGI